MKPAGHGETKSMRRMVDSIPRATAAHSHCPIAGVDAGVVDQRKINYEAIITYAQAARAVAAAANRDEHSILTAKIDRGDNVGNVGTAQMRLGRRSIMPLYTFRASS